MLIKCEKCGRGMRKPEKHARVQCRLNVLNDRVFRVQGKLADAGWARTYQTTSCLKGTGARIRRGPSGVSFQNDELAVSWCNWAPQLAVAIAGCTEISTVARRAAIQILLTNPQRARAFEAEYRLAHGPVESAQPARYLMCDMIKGLLDEVKTGRKTT